MQQKPQRPDQNYYSRRASTRRRKRARRNRFLALCALALVVLVAAIVLLIKLLSGGEQEEPESLPPSTTTSETPVSSAPPEPPPDPYADHIYYEEAMPLLCNAWNPLPDSYEDTLTLASVGTRPGYGEIEMETRAAAAFNEMAQAAAEENITLSPYSGYRSNERQRNNYNASINSYMEQGFSREQAEEKTQEYYAIPGTSEHEAGLAIDINGTETSFENTPAFAWLQENCSDYGFILRYEKDTKDITGIAYEPWHYRYVGINHAKAIQEQGITLEEYVQAGAE